MVISLAQPTKNQSGLYVAHNLKWVDITIQKCVNNFIYAVNVLSRKYRHLRDTLNTN